MGDRLSLTLANDVAEVVRLAAAAERFLEENDVSGAPADSVQLALEEVVTNVIKYGFDDDGAHDVRVSLSVGEDAVLLSIEDDGHPFDPLQAPEPDLDAPLEQRQVGGLGLHLVRQMVDEATYRRVGDTNRIELRVAVPREA